MVIYIDKFSIIFNKAVDLQDTQAAAILDSLADVPKLKS